MKITHNHQILCAHSKAKRLIKLNKANKTKYLHTSIPPSIHPSIHACMHACINVWFCQYHSAIIYSIQNIELYIYIYIYNFPTFPDNSKKNSMNCNPGSNQSQYYHTVVLILNCFLDLIYFHQLILTTDNVLTMQKEIGN